MSIKVQFIEASEIFARDFFYKEYYTPYVRLSESIQFSISTLRSIPLAFKRAWKSHGERFNLLQTSIIVNSLLRYLSRSLSILSSSKPFFRIFLRYSDLSRFISLIKLVKSFKNLSDTLTVVGFNTFYLLQLVKCISNDVWRISSYDP